MNSNKNVIGLTGGIGTGKSTAASYLLQKGFHHIDADRIGWELTADGSPMLLSLNEIFGPDAPMGTPGIKILNDDHTLNRKALASIVFSDHAKTEKLNQLMFDTIIQRIREAIDSIRLEHDDPWILLDAPLLFEAGADSLCEKTILITADDQTRIQRVCQRDHTSEEEVRQRMRHQLSDKEKIQKSDYIVDNSGNLEELHKKLDEICQLILDKSIV